MKRPSNKKKQGKKQEKKPDGKMRLNRFIAHAGVCSRREADKLIADGKIKINGKVVTELGTKVEPADEVKFNGKVLSTEKFVYILMNKPKDCITTVDDPRGRKTVMQLLRNKVEQRVYPVGRLDRDSTGILLLTNDGGLAKKLTHPKHEIKKVYRVELEREVTKEEMNQLVEGVELEDGKAVADVVSYDARTGAKNHLMIDLHSGKNRVIRRMMEAVGHKVIKLDRVSFAGLTKQSVQRGHWRFLKPNEVGLLKRAAGR